MNNKKSYLASKAAAAHANRPSIIPTGVMNLHHVCQPPRPRTPVQQAFTARGITKYTRI